MRLTIRRGEFELSAELDGAGFCGEDWIDDQILSASRSMERVMDLISPPKESGRRCNDPAMVAAVQSVVQFYVERTRERGLGSMVGEKDKRALRARLREKLDGDPSIDQRIEYVKAGIAGALQNEFLATKSLWQLGWICASWVRLQQQAGHLRNGQRGDAVRAWVEGKR